MSIQDGYMVYANLRAFTHKLEQLNKLKHVTAEVDKDWEIACIARWAMECVADEKAFAIQFDNIKGYDAPVVVGLYSSYDLYAKALNIGREEILSYWSQALKAPIKPTVVAAAPVQEIIETGDNINLSSIPIPVWTPGRDGGPYIPSASIITKDPATGIQNMGVYRIQIHDEKTTGLFFGTHMQHGAMHYAKYRQHQTPMPIAIVIGGPPAVHFAAPAKTAYGVDELDIAGALAGASIEVVRGKTVDLLVPAQAEYVIEGFVPLERRIMEGPFGEALGYMNFAAPAPVVEVSAICRRDAPIFHGYVQQLPPSEGHLVWEMGLLGGLWFYCTEKLGLSALRDLAVIRGSAGISMLAAQVKIGHAAEARRIGEVLSTINFGQKFVVVVDEDIDVHDLPTLQWALSSRVDPAHDVHVLKDIRTYQLDPSVLARITANDGEKHAPPYLSSMMVIDATLKCDTPEISLPGKSLMVKALERWSELGLPKLSARERIDRLLKYHTQDGVRFTPP
jgi:UbiD family decarboxylase